MCEGGKELKTGGDCEGRGVVASDLWMQRKKNWLCFLKPRKIWVNNNSHNHNIVQNGGPDGKRGRNGDGD